jgi:hypothetical protein
MTTKHDRLVNKLYPVALVVRKAFERGILKGIAFNDTVRFISRERAASWVRGVRRNYRAGKLEYRLVRVEVVL